MRFIKPLLVATLSAGLLLSVSACTTSPTPKPTTSLSAAQVKTAQAQVAETYETFTNGVFGMSKATATKLSGIYANVTTTNYLKLTDAQATKITTETLAEVPALKYVDVSKYTPQQQVAVYASTLSIAEYAVGTKTMTSVDATQVKIAADGKSASIPTSALIVSQNGTTATPAATASTQTIPFKKVGQTWYIDGASVIGSVE